MLLLRRFAPSRALRAGAPRAAAFLAAPKAPGAGWKPFLAVAAISFLGNRDIYCEAPTEELHLSKADESLLVKILDDGVENLCKWALAPASWWDECHSLRLGGLKDAKHFTRRMEGFPIRLQMVSAEWEDVSLKELLVLSEASETCLKLTFDPVINSMTTRLRFGDGRARLLRTMTNPTLMGLISAREVDSVLREPEKLPDGTVAGGGIGLQSPLLVDKVKESEWILALAAVPPSAGKVRAVDHTSGFIFQPCDAAAKSGDDCKGRWKVHYILLSEAGGGVPLWAADKGVSKAMADWFTAAHKEWASWR
ncbi:unnamed protein product [Effrenium voratum]|uniref:START domain-containing protein n=1 Tax=Effrenium voratum TaxID=2562239 RepID=A0AA36MMG0_9DINO|nr:unnamed protein product [Effrenium voratum]